MPTMVPWTQNSLVFNSHAGLRISGNISLSAAGQVVFPNSHALLHVPVVTQLPVPRGYARFRSRSILSIGNPFAAFRDFSIVQNGAFNDPAQVIVGATNAGATTHDGSTTSGMRRFYLSAAGPANAKYMAAGMKFASMANNVKQYMDGVQVEVPSLGASAPSAYAPARGLTVTVKPTRLNYVRNSNFNHAASVSHWTGDQLTSDTVVTVPSWNTVSGATLPVMQVVVPSTAPAGGHPDHRISQPITDLLPGRTYTVSFRVTKAVNCAIIWTLVDNAYVMSDADGMDDPNNDRWVTIWATFTATATSHTVGLAIRPQDKIAGVTNTFYFTGVLMEEGYGPQDYFDGEDGADYLYEAGVGATVDARSFFYEDRANRSYLLVQLLSENAPLGVLPGTPTYGVVPSQSLAAPVSAPKPVIFPSGSHQAPGYPGTGTIGGGNVLGGKIGPAHPLAPLPVQH